MRLNRIKIVAYFVMVALLFESQFSYALNISGIDYMRPQDASITYGNNLTHNNSTRGIVAFPIKESVQPVYVGTTKGQPLILDHYVFVQTSKAFTVVNKQTGKKLCEYSINASVDATPLIVKQEKDHYLAFVSSGNSIICLDIMVNTLQIKLLWTSEAIEGQRNSLNIVEDSLLDKNYIIGVSTAGQLFILQSDTGDIVNNGLMNLSGTTNGQAPIVYYDAENRTSKYIFPVTTGTKGYLQGGTVINGVNQPSFIYNEGMQLKQSFLKLGNPATLEYIKDATNGGTLPVLILQEGSGIITAINPDKGEVLFRIKRYEGNTMKHISIKDTTALVEFNTTNKAFIVAVNINKAIEMGMDHQAEGYNADSAVIFKQDLNGLSNTNPLSFSIMDTQTDSYGQTLQMTYSDVFLAADSGKDGLKSNLYMFYLNKLDSTNRLPQKVLSAFTDGKASTPEVVIPGGVFSMMSMAGGTLAYVDGLGYLHLLNALQKNNISILNLTNTSSILTPGGTYTTSFDVVNYTGKSLSNVPLKFTIKDSTGQVVHTYSDTVTFAEDGCTVNFQYTLPGNFSSNSLTITADLNTVNRVVEEDTYMDNTLTAQCIVKDNVDIAVSEIKETSYPAAKKITLYVKVSNHSDNVLASPKVPVVISIQYKGETFEKVKEIALDASSTVYIPFSFTTPDENTSLIVSAEVNRTKVYTEKDYGNNKKSVTVTITKNSHSSDDNRLTTW